MQTLYLDRLARVARELQGAGVDALLLTPGASMFYLSGFEHGHAAERLLALVIKKDGSVSWIIPTMNVEQVKASPLGDRPIRAWGDGEGYLPPLREIIGAAKSIAFDDDARAAFLLDIASVAPFAKLSKASSVMRALRARKDSAELDRLRAAGKIVDETIARAVSLCRAGVRECDLEAELRAALMARSPESAVAFTIVASGPNGALPHHETARRILQKGDVVILDFGVREPGGYHSDITVTCAVGEPADPEVRKVYQTVWEAQQAAIKAVRPGAKCEDVDRAARGVIEAAGYGPYFLHRTGHGLGLQVHEPPFMVGGNTEVLEEGMVFSIEPGIYLPGRFGVRLEIIASVSATGVSLINEVSAAEIPLSRE
jgi:Xaa-Pro dipeptidase